MAYTPKYLASGSSDCKIDVDKENKFT